MFKPGIEKEFEVVRYNGNTETHKILYNQYALYTFEERMGTSFQEWLESIRVEGSDKVTISFRAIHLLFWCGLEGAKFHKARVLNKEHHPMEVIDASEFIDGVGGIVEATTIAMSALPSALAGPDEEKEIEEVTGGDEAGGDVPNSPRVPEAASSGASDQPSESELTPTPSGS